MAMLFVSYSRDDRHLSGPLLADLDALGHEVWVDEDLSGGQVWWDEILATIRRSDALLFLLTPTSLASEACLREVEYAQAVDRPVIPVELVVTDPVLVPTLLSRHQVVRYLNGDKADTIALTRALAHSDLARPLPDPLPPEPPLPGSYFRDLREQIASRQQLGIDEQLGLLQRLKARAEAGDAEEVLPLLATLRAREDVYATVAMGIDQLSTSLGRAPPRAAAGQRSPRLLRSPRGGLEWTAVGMSGAGLLLGVLALLSNPLYRDEAPSDWNWGQSSQDVPRWAVALFLALFAAAAAVALMSVASKVRRVAAVVAALVAALLLLTWWDQISTLLGEFAQKVHLGPAMILLSWSVGFVCLGATLVVVAAFSHRFALSTRRHSR